MTVTIDAFIEYFGESRTFSKILYKSIIDFKPRTALEFNNFVERSM